MDLALILDKLSKALRYIISLCPFSNASSSGKRIADGVVKSQVITRDSYSQLLHQFDDPNNQQTDIKNITNDEFKRSYDKKYIRIEEIIEDNKKYNWIDAAYLIYTENVKFGRSQQFSYMLSVIYLLSKLLLEIMRIPATGIGIIKDIDASKRNPIYFVIKCGIPTIIKTVIITGSIYYAHKQEVETGNAAYGMLFSGSSALALWMMITTLIFLTIELVKIWKTKSDDVVAIHTPV